MGVRLLLLFVTLAVICVGNDQTFLSSTTKHAASDADSKGRASSNPTTNYASALLGAKIVEAHQEAQSVNSILNDDRNKYLIIPCMAVNKTFTVQLSREIEVTTVALANFEFFSSSVKHFEIVGARRFPCNKPECLWRRLASHRANHTRDLQMFPVTNQQPVRYIRFLWATHYGRERGCTLSTFQVFGRDVLDNLAAELIVDDTPYKDIAAAKEASRNQGDPASLNVHREVDQSPDGNFRPPQRNKTSTVCTLEDKEAELFFFYPTCLPSLVVHQPPTNANHVPPSGGTGTSTSLQQIRALKAAQQDVTALQAKLKEKEEEIALLNESLQVLANHLLQFEKVNRNLTKKLDSLSFDLNSEVIRRELEYVHLKEQLAGKQGNIWPMVLLVSIPNFLGLIVLLALCGAHVFPQSVAPATSPTNSQRQKMPRAGSSWFFPSQASAESLDIFAEPMPKKGFNSSDSAIIGSEKESR